MNSQSGSMIIAVLGGTGKEGKGLIHRWARAGYRLIIGSRSAERAKAAASDSINLLNGEAKIDGMSNLEAVRKADVVVLAVPYSAHRQTLEEIRRELQGKLLIDVTVPLVPPRVTRAQMPPAGSAAQEAVEILGNEVEVCTAFQNIAYEHLMKDALPNCDVLVTGTGKEARDQTLRLVAAAGMQGWDAGPIENSMVVEGLTSILIHINKQYGSDHAGIAITGIDLE